MKRIFTSNTAYLPYIQAILAIATFTVPFFHDSDPRWWLVAIGMYLITGCFGIAIAYHRLLTHQSFRINKYLEYLFTFFGAIGCTGSAIGWVGVHHQHHRFSDQPRDPHSPRYRGLRVVIAAYEFEVNKWAIRHLITNPFHLFLHKYYFLIVGIWAAALALISFDLFFYGFVVASTLHIFFSTFSNYSNHRWGYRNFDVGDDSTNCWFMALLTFGEGWHNNHHGRPKSYTYTVKWWELDPAGWVIRAIKA